MSTTAGECKQGICFLAKNVRKMARELPESSPARHDGEIVSDLNKIAEASDQMCALVADLVAPDAAVRFEVSVARHNLRNPLNNIIGYTEMILEDLDGEAEGRDTAFAGSMQELYVLSRRLLQEVNAIDSLPLGATTMAAKERDACLLFERKQQPPAPDLRAVFPDGKPLIMVVDDQEMNREVLCRRLSKLGYLVLDAESGERALAILETEGFDLVLLDIMMPGMDGYEVLRKIKQNERLRHLPVLMITAVGDIDSVVNCLEAGADDYLTKPFNSALLQARISSSLVKKRFYDQEISRAQLAAIFSLSKLAESRDPETGEHLERIREYCRLLAEELRKLSKYRVLIDEPFIENLFAASPLHDIGKVGIPDAVLLKPGRLTPEEFVIMRTHTTIGAETLLAVDRQYPGSDMIRFGIEISEGHHERWDGSGYPHGLAGEEIPLVARIVGLADVYDALRSRRVYKDEMGHSEARKIIVEGRGNHFDPQIVDAFLASEDEFQRIRQRLGE